MPTDLRTALHELAAQGHGVSPSARLTAITRRAGHRRRRRLAGMAVAALLLVAGVLAFPRGSHPQFVAADLTTWPDRSESGEVPVSAGALTAFATARQVTPEQVHWLLRRAVLRGDGATHVAVFVATLTGQRALVTAVRVDRVGEPTPSSWETVVTPLTTRLDHVGLYLPQFPGSDPGNIGLFLDAPGRGTLSWAEQPLPGTEPGQESARGTASSRNGVYELRLGQLRGPVAVTRHGRTVPLAATAGAASTPYLVRPELPDEFRVVVGQAGQGDDGSQISLSHDPGPGPVGVRTACYGGGTLTMVLRRAADNRVLWRGSAACDGGTYEQGVLAGAPGRGALVLQAHPDRLVAYAIQLVRR